MKETEVLGHIEENGTLKIHKRSEFLESVKILGNGKYTPVILVVKKRYKKRSPEQNMRYWGYIIVEFCRGWFEMTGEKITKEQAHEFLKTRFLFIEVVNEETGEVVRMPKSSANLTTVKYMEFNDDCSKFIEEWFGIKILDRDEQSTLDFNRAEKL